jgi:hypothetical protein
MAKFLLVYRSDKNTLDTMVPEELQLFHQKCKRGLPRDSGRVGCSTLAPR